MMIRQAASSVLGLLGVAPAVLAASSIVAHAEPGATTGGQAQAEVVQPLRAIPLADLSFGSIALTASQAGSVSVPADGGAVSYTSSVRSACGGDSACAPHPASFEVTGEADRSYRVTLPGNVIATGQLTGTTLAVSDLVMRSLNQPAMDQGGRLGADGSDRFNVGGTLDIPAGTQPDLFRAQLPVLVSYD